MDIDVNNVVKRDAIKIRNNILMFVLNAKTRFGVNQGKNLRKSKFFLSLVNSECK